MSQKSQIEETDQLGFLLGRAYYSYIGLLQRWLEKSGLSEHLKPGFVSLLFALFREDNRTMTAVGEELQLAKSTMTGMVARMSDAGLIQIVDDDDDRRSCRLILTQQARRLEPICHRLAVEMESVLGAKLTAAERETFRRALQLVTQTITEELAKNEIDRPKAKPKTSPDRRARKMMKPTRST